MSAKVTRRIALLGAGGYLLSCTASSRSRPAPRPPVVLQARGDYVSTLAVSRSGRFAVSGHIDFSREGRGQRGGVIVWDLEARRAIGRYEASIPASTVAISFDEELILVGGSGAAKVIRRAGGAVVRQFPISIISEAYAGAFSPDGERVVLYETTHGGPDEQPEPWTKVWELRTGKVLRAFPRRAKAFARGAGLAIDWKGPLWSVVTGRDESAARLPPSFWTAWAVRALTDDGGLAFVSPIIEGRGAAGLWDPVRGGEVRRLTGHKEHVGAGAFTGDGKRVVTGSGSKSGKDCTVRVWDVSTARELATLGRHETGVRALAVSPDGRRVVSGDEGGGVLLWEVEA